MPIKIDFVSNTSAFLRGTADTENALDKVADSLDDVARDGDKAQRELERNFREIAGAAKDSSRKVADEGEAGFRKLGDKGAEVSDELKGNLGETFSSFRGDLQDLPQIAQDTLGGLAGSGALGGIAGLAATAAGAAGIGLIIGALEATDERAEALKQRANDMAKAFIDAGTNVVTATSVAAASADVLTDNDKRKEVQAYADALGVDLATAVRAYVGDANAMAVVDKIATDAKRENLDIAEKQKGATTALTDAQLDTIKGNQAAINAQRELNSVLDDANAKFNDQQSVLKGLINDASSASKEVDELGNAVYSLPDGTQIMIDAETGQATTDLTKFKGDLDGVTETVTSRIKVEVDSSSWDNWVPRLKKGTVDTYVTQNGRMLQ